MSSVVRVLPEQSNSVSAAFFDTSSALRSLSYASEEFRNTLASSVVQSMSRKGNCWDNAVAENFFKSLKCEMIYGNRVLSAEVPELEVFEWIEIWYNKIRRYKALGNMTITEFWNLNKISA